MVRQILCVALVALTTLSANAQRKPFEATATSTTNPALTVTASGSNFADFISAIVKADGAFQTLSTQAYTARSTFLGVADAITFSRNANGTSVTMTLAPIGFSRTFTGATEDAVDDQIETFYETEGAKTIGDFLKKIAETSPVALTDGNPNSATAIAASASFIGQGFTPAEDLADNAAGTSTGSKFGGFAIGFNAGKFEAAGFEGDNLDISISGLNFGLSERVRLVTPIHINYLKVGDAAAFGIGGGLALPIRLRVMDAANAWNWRLTPNASVGLRGSADLASGALLWQAGLTNTIDYKVAPKLVVSMVNQLTSHKSIAVTYEDFEFDPQVDQQIMKNGFRAVTPLTTRLIGDFFVVDTRFLKDAAVDQFFTVGASVSLRASQSWNLTLGGNYDSGDNFKAWSVGLSSAWRW